MFIWENISLSRRDPGRVQARSWLAGKMSYHTNAVDILCGSSTMAAGKREHEHARETFSI